MRWFFAVGFLVAVACDTVPELRFREAGSAEPGSERIDDVLGVLAPDDAGAEAGGDSAAPDAAAALCPSDTEPRCCGTTYCVGKKARCEEWCGECRQTCKGQLCCIVNTKGVKSCGNSVEACQKNAEQTADEVTL